MKQYSSLYFCNMKHSLLKHIIVCTIFLFFSCNNQSDSKEKAGINNTLLPEINRLQDQLKAHPDSTGIRFQLANLFDSIGNYTAALIEMDSLIKKDSANYGLWFNKATIYEHAKDTQKAILGYSSALKIYPAPQALLSLANLYAEQKDKTSLLICNQVKKMKLGREYDAHCAFIAGVYNARTNQPSLAIPLFDECIANDYTYMEAYIEKGMVYFDNGQFNQALSVFRFASSVNNLYADAYYYMARCYEKMNIKDSAVMRFKQSLSLDKNLTEANEGLKRLGIE